MNGYNKFEETIMREVLEASIIYVGSVSLNYNDLLNLAKRNGKTKEFFDFYDEYYKKPLENILSCSIKGNFYPGIDLDLNREKTNRIIHFSYIGLVEWLSSILDISNEETFVAISCEDGLSEDRLSFISKIKSLIKQERLKMTVGNNNVDDEKLKKIYNNCPSNYNFEEYLEGRKNWCIKTAIRTPEIVDLYDKPIDIDTFVSLFNLDQLLLYIAGKTISLLNLYEKETGNAHQIAIILYMYNDFLNYRKQQRKDYFEKVKTDFYIDQDKIMHQFTTDDFEKIFHEFQEKHQDDFRIVRLEMDNDLRIPTTIEEADEFRKQLEEEYLARLVGVEFEIIPSGNKEEIDNCQEEIDKVVSSIKNTKKQKDLLTKIKDIYTRKTFFQNTDYRYEIRGTDKFSGYVGYIYKNGMVIFEKYYKNIKTKEPAEYEATYVMSISNFIELSRLTKPEIIDYISKGQDGNVKRIYHTDKWQIKICKQIEKPPYELNLVNKIDHIISVAGRIKGKKYE